MKTLQLSDENLLQAYKQALKLNLETEFIYMLEKELQIRALLKQPGENDPPIRKV